MGNLARRVWAGVMLLVASLSGCATIQSRDMIGLSYGESRQLVSDIVSPLVRDILESGRPAVVVSASGDIFGDELVQALQKRGIRVIKLPSFSESDVGRFKGGEIVGVSYDIDVLGDKVAIIVESTNGLFVSRVYMRNGSGILPSGPLSITSKGG